MIRFNKEGRPVEPITREELIKECIRLQALIGETVRSFCQRDEVYLQNEAKVLAIGLKRSEIPSAE